MSRKILSLDVRDTHIHAVLLSSSLRENRIEGATSVPIGEDTEAAGGLTLALRQIAEQLTTEGEISCVVALPPGLASVRNVQVPFRNAKKIAQVLPFELEPLLPFPVDSLIIDFLELSANGNGDQTHVLALAVPRDSLAEILGEFKAAGMDPISLTVGGYAMAGWLPDPEESKDGESLLLEFDGHHGLLVGISKNDIVMARNFPFRSSDPERLCAVLKQTYLTVSASLPEFHPETLFLSGAGISNLEENDLAQLRGCLGMPVAPLDVSAHPDAKIDPSSAQGGLPPALNAALALALSETESKPKINFRKGPFARRTKWSAYRKPLITGAVFLTILLLMGGVGFYLDAFRMERKLERIDAQIRQVFQTAFPDVQRIVEPVQQMKTAIDDLKKETLFPVESPSVRVIDILRELSQRIPEKTDILFTRMVISPDSILISGDTDSFNSVDDTQNNLESAEMFAKVTIVSTEIDKNSKRVRFKIKIDL